MNTSPSPTSGSTPTALLCLIAAACGAIAALFFAQKEKTAVQTELAALRENARQTESKSTDPKEVEKLRAESRGMAELRKEAEEVHRLRAEVTQLRKDKAAFDKASAEIVTLREKAQLAQRLQSENETLRNQYQSFVQTMQQVQALGVQPAAAQKNSCIAHLKQIDGAIQQWALENRKVAASLVEMRGVLPYLKGSLLPVCPSGGHYLPGPSVSAAPTCSVAGHTL